ncbi:MAG TPA: metallophosphoesterase [Xanthobacteraceae bacterium]|jgi:3',5'-cyclic AMP phosphodiesterase CpdA|nr:metallophosphoesterase [Xanthobacteraceae bacterium]
MFVLAHLSDLHMALKPRPAQLLSKRGLGFVNWHRKRKHIHRRDILDGITRDLKAQAKDHVAVTGDLINLSLPIEYELGREWLKALGSPSDVTVIPGNHDVYVRQVTDAPATYWGDYMTGDDGKRSLPFLRRRNGVALIALSSGVATGPFMATGRLGAPQLRRLAEMLEETRDAFRIVLIHHPPISPPRRHLRRLIDGTDLRGVLAAKGAELLLHGHDHQRALLWLDGLDKTIPAIGVPSASARAPHGDEDGAGYHLFNIDGTVGDWRCDMIARQRNADGTVKEAERVTVYPSS